jgi:hypothetical protein
MTSALLLKDSNYSELKLVIIEDSVIEGEGVCSSSLFSYCDVFFFFFFFFFFCACVEGVWGKKGGRRICGYK